MREVIFPKVEEEIFKNLVAEFRANGPQLRLLRQQTMQPKFSRHYRRMLPALLENLQFRSDNRFQPIIEALSVLRKHLASHQKYFPEAVPIEGVVTPSWAQKVLEQVSGTKEVRSRETLRLLLILDLFAEGTNMGIRRVASANRQYSYEELLYVRKTYFSPEARIWIT